MASITIANKILELLLHFRPTKNEPNSLESLVIPLMSAVVELSYDSLRDGRISLEVDTVLEIDEGPREDSMAPRLHPSLSFLPKPGGWGLAVPLVGLAPSSGELVQTKP